MSTIFGKHKETWLKSFNKYGDHFARKAKAIPLKDAENCLFLSPKLSNEHEKNSNMQCKWMARYKLENVLTRSNYLMRKIGRNRSRNVHRVRLKTI